MKLPMSFAKVSLTFAFLALSKCITAQYVSLQSDYSRNENIKTEKSNTNNHFYVNLFPSENPLNFKIAVNNPNNDLLFIQLKNDSNKLFQDDIFYRRSHYTMQLNVARLEDGIYSLSIKTNHASFTRNLKIETTGLSTKNKQMIIEREVIISDEEHPIQLVELISSMN